MFAGSVGGEMRSGKANKSRRGTLARSGLLLDFAARGSPKSQGSQKDGKRANSGERAANDRDERHG
jgi:hypothetical protein